MPPERPTPDSCEICHSYLMDKDPSEHPALYVRVGENWRHRACHTQAEEKALTLRLRTSQAAMQEMLVEQVPRLVSSVHIIAVLTFGKFMATGLEGSGAVADMINKEVKAWMQSIRK